MKWVDTKERLPETKQGSSDVVLAWVVESKRNKYGIATIAFYSDSGDWIDSNGLLSKRGWVVTHWAAIEPPKA